MKDYKPKAAEYKQEEVDRLKSAIQKYKVIAIADMTNMPAHQLQKMRSSLRNTIFITMSKGRLIKIVFNELKSKIKGIEELNEHLRGMPALLLTNESPFKLASVLKRNKSQAPAKGGQIAPNDIIVPAGPTSFPPGPIMGELGSLGIKSGVVDGKIAVKEDKLLVKEGQVISPEAASILTRLGIQPMEIGINLLAAYENNTIFTKQVLTVDEKEYLQNIQTAYRNSFNLAFNVAFPIKENIKLLIKKAYLDTSGLADSRKIITNDNVKRVIGKANLEAESLKSKLNLDANNTE